jgi:hypothetical protein
LVQVRAVRAQHLSATGCGCCRPGLAQRRRSAGCWILLASQDRYSPATGLPECSPGACRPLLCHPTTPRTSAAASSSWSVHGPIGLLTAGAVNGILAIVDGVANGAWAAVVTAAWIADAVLAAVAVLTLLVTVAVWGWYRRRCADLDAAAPKPSASCAHRQPSPRRARVTPPPAT